MVGNRSAYIARMGSLHVADGVVVGNGWLDLSYNYGDLYALPHSK